MPHHLLKTKKINLWILTKLKKKEKTEIKTKNHINWDLALS